MAEIWGALAGGLVAAGGTVSASLLNKQNAPGAAPYANVDPTQVQNNAISGDLSSLSNATQLASGVNSTNLQTSIANLNSALPGFSSYQQSVLGQAQEKASNPYGLPQEAIDQINQQAAENNIGSGTGAKSGFSGSNALRSLGVSTLDYGQQNFSDAISALSTLTGTAPTVSPVSPLNFLLTPSQALGTATTNAQENQQIQQGSNNADAAAGNYNSSNLFDALTGSGLINQLGSTTTSLIKAAQIPTNMASKQVG